MKLKEYIKLVLEHTTGDVHFDVGLDSAVNVVMNSPTKVSFTVQRTQVVDLDNPENNCSFCGVDHHYAERDSTVGQKTKGRK